MKNSSDHMHNPSVRLLSHQRNVFPIFSIRWKRKETEARALSRTSLLASLAPGLKRKDETQNHKQSKQRRADKQRSRRLHVCIAPDQDAQNAADSIDDDAEAVARGAMRRWQDLRGICINRTIIDVATQKSQKRQRIYSKGK